jgi:hypothetical protein
MAADPSQSTINQQSVLTAKASVKNQPQHPVSKRILLTGINSLVGHSLFE